MRSTLDYLLATPREALVKRVLGLFYGTIALARAQMLASPSGSIDLDQVEGMTKRGRGLYAHAGSRGGFADLRAGVLATGFPPQWMNFLGHYTSGYPKTRPGSAGDLDNVSAGMACSHPCPRSTTSLPRFSADSPTGSPSPKAPQKSSSDELT